MSKINIKGVSIQVEGLVMGALTATGVGLIALSVKNFLDAGKIRQLEMQPVDDEEEYGYYCAHAESAPFLQHSSERSPDEEPEVTQGRSPGEDGLRDGTGRVDGGVGQRDADEVDEHQGEADG